MMQKPGEEVDDAGKGREPTVQASTRETLLVKTFFLVKDAHCFTARDHGGNSGEVHGWEDAGICRSHEKRRRYHGACQVGSIVAYQLPFLQYCLFLLRAHAIKLSYLASQIPIQAKIIFECMY